MKDSIAHYIGGLANETLRRWLRVIIDPIGDRLSSQNVTSAVLAIKAGGSAVVKGSAAFNGIAKGRLYTKVINTDMAALVGTVVNATFNVWVFSVDAAGTLRSDIGNAGATLGAVTFPEPLFNQAIIGYVIINPTGTGNFVGGTTALDDATVVPNAVYVNITGGFDPTVLVL